MKCRLSSIYPFIHITSPSLYSWHDAIVSFQRLIPCQGCSLHEGTETAVTTGSHSDAECGFASSEPVFHLWL